MPPTTASNSPQTSSPTTQLTQPRPLPESQLLATVQAAGIRELARATTDELREVLADMSVGLTRQAASSAPKIFRLNHSLGPGVVVKLLVVVLRAFVDSVRVPDKMGAADIIECAEALAQIYTHDSIKDIILALKEARLGGYKFYQALDPAQLFEMVAAYFDRKATWLEHQHRDQKARSTSRDQSAVAQLQAAGTAIHTISRQLDPQHPNHESLRRKLTITNQKEKRGLITPTQAHEQRQQVQTANQRKPRADWQPGEAAQRRIDARNRAEDRLLLNKYRPPSY